MGGTGERVAYRLGSERLGSDVSEDLKNFDLIFLEPFVHVVLDGGGVVFESFEDFNLMHLSSPVSG